MSRNGSGAANTRAQLLATAAAEIRQIGPKRMTIVALAARLGMSHANVYRFFPDKLALIDGVLNLWLRGLETRLADIVDGPDPADDKLERFLATLARGYAETLKQDGAIFRLLAAPIAGASEPARHRQRVLDGVTRIVDEGVATRLFGGSDVRRAAILAVDLAYRFIDAGALLAAEGEGAPSDARRDRAIRAVIRALTGLRGRE